MVIGWKCACCLSTYPKGKSAKKWTECPQECYHCGGDIFIRVEDENDEPINIPYKTSETNMNIDYTGWVGDGTLVSSDYDYLGMFGSD